MLREPIAIIGDILINQMGLDSQRIWAFNQSKVQPKDGGIWIVIEYLASKPIATNRSFSTDDDLNYVETIVTNTEEMYSIHVFSQDNSARQRKEEVLNALASSFSVYQQEINSFKIAKVVQRINNASYLDGSAMLNRFVIDTKILAWYKTTKIIDYYNQFPTTIITN